MSDKQIIATVNGRKISCAAGIRLGDLLSSGVLSPLPAEATDGAGNAG